MTADQFFKCDNLALSPLALLCFVIPFFHLFLLLFFLSFFNFLTSLVSSLVYFSIFFFLFPFSCFFILASSHNLALFYFLNEQDLVFKLIILVRTVPPPVRWSMISSLGMQMSFRKCIITDAWARPRLA